MTRRIRYHTWYWGKFVLEGTDGFSLEQDGFEVYDEERHGWHNSEEARR
jgi:hypothetical protein